jgi:hypothetical protein
MKSSSYSSISTILLLIICNLAGCATENSSQLDFNIQAEELQAHIHWLANPELEGRLAGSEHEAMAANYISDIFSQIGLETGGNDDTYLQKFTLEGPMAQAMNRQGYLSRNVIGIIPGNREIENYIVIGAHYDAQGEGGIISMEGSVEPEVHPGADDNASGTAGLLELAHYFKEHQPNRTLVFIAFSGEELGLLGSRYFVENSTLPEGQILAMVNLDMIGRMEDNKVSIMGTGTSEAWPELIEESNRDSLDINLVSSGRGASDHTSFYEKGIPVLHYFTGTHPDYHRPGDTADKINIDGTVKVVRHVKEVIARLDEIDQERLAFVESGQRESEEMRMEGVTLGVMPDYTYDGAGLKIESVRSGDKGDEAGIIDGDIIVEIDGDHVDDIFRYMDLLSRFEVGDTMRIIVLRDGEEVNLEVTF